MNQAMWISKTGLQAQDSKLQSIANNLANVNTDGFKRDRTVFEDLFYRAERQPGAQLDQNVSSPLGIQLGSGVRLVGTQKVFTGGNTKNTGQELDVAIMGRGFLQVQLSNGDTAYTRAGQLQLNGERILTNAQGLPLLPEIAIPENVSGIVISENGVVSAQMAGAALPAEVGQIQLANFPNPAGLLAMGDNLFQQTLASGDPVDGDPGIDALGKLKQYALEGSNVNVVEEMVDMITAQRAYEMNVKMISAADNMLQQLAQAAR